MKYLLPYLLLLFSVHAIAQTSPCERTTHFGKVAICLPKMENYKECYLEPDFKAVADATEAPTNSVLGYYVNKKAYAEKDNEDTNVFNDYFKIYATDQIKDVPMNKSMLNEMESHFGGVFTSKEWGKLQDEIEAVVQEVKVDKPLVIKNYKLNKNSFTYVLLIKYEQEGEEPYIVATTISGLLMRKRLIWMAHYLIYENEETIEQLQKNSNEIVEEILNSNK